MSGTERRRMHRSRIQILVMCLYFLVFSACEEGSPGPANSAADAPRAAVGERLGSIGAAVKTRRPEAGTKRSQAIASRDRREKPTRVRPSRETNPSAAVPATPLVPVQSDEVFWDYFSATPPAADDCLLDSLVNPQMANVAPIGPAGFGTDTARSFSSDPPSSSDQPATQFSSTNLQQAGVDEADRIKFDGEFLFIANSPASSFVPSIGTPIFLTPIVTPTVVPTVVPTVGTFDISALILTGPPDIFNFLRTDWTIPEREPPPPPTVRVMASNPDAPGAHEVASISVPNAEHGISGLYHLPSDDSGSNAVLAVLGSGSGADGSFRSSTTTLDLFDVDDPADPESEVDLVIDGTMMASRQIDGRLILVTRFNVPRPHPIGCRTLAADAPEPDETAPFVRLPQIRVGGGEPKPLVVVGNCFVPASQLADPYGSRQLTTVTSIDLRNPDDRISMCLPGGGGAAYASDEVLYLQQNRFSPFQPISGPQYGTRIFKIALDDAGPIFRGSALVEGNLSTRFAMGEHEGVLGVVTTVNWSEHRLTLLREREELSENPHVEPTLEIVSQLPNDTQPASIGKPGEALHAVRFIGSRVYVVTFKKIDPLYVIDVSNPHIPFIAGEVEVPGFSDYLHPIGENLLLGIGKDGFDMGLFAWFQGIKLELFDVSDPTTLSSIDSVSIGMRGSHTAALYDHHAVAHLPLGGGLHRLTVPVEVHEGPESEPNARHPWVETSLFQFEVEENSNPRESRLDNVGAIVRAVPSSEFFRYSDSLTTGDRAVLSGDQVHYIHDDEVWSASWFAPEDAVGPQ